MWPISGHANTLLLVLVLAVGIGILAMLASGARSGPLDPPAAPASTDGVRQPGTPISTTNFFITQPGRYYLTRNLIAGADEVASGITIQTDNVTLDLNGFTLKGGGSSIDGVLVSGARTGIIIQNGIIRGWYNGIDASQGTYVTISRVTVLDNGIAAGDGSYGITMGANSTLEECNVSHNKSAGVLVRYSTMRGCIITQNGLDGALVLDRSLIQHNQFFGNNTAGSLYAFDIRLIAGSYVSDNYLREVGVDRTSQISGVKFERNTFCGYVQFGSFNNDDTFPAYPNPEFNQTLC